MLVAGRLYSRGWAGWLLLAGVWRRRLATRCSRRESHRNHLATFTELGTFFLHICAQQFDPVFDFAHLEDDRPVASHIQDTDSNIISFHLGHRDEAIGFCPGWRLGSRLRSRFRYDGRVAEGFAVEDDLVTVEVLRGSLGRQCAKQEGTRLWLLARLPLTASIAWPGNTWL